MIRTIFKYFFRIVAFPFVACIILIVAIRNYLYTCWRWLRYGGELMTHDKVFNPETIRELLHEAMNKTKSALEAASEDKLI